MKFYELKEYSSIYTFADVRDLTEAFYSLKSIFSLSFFKVILLIIVKRPGRAWKYCWDVYTGFPGQ